MFQLKSGARSGGDVRRISEESATTLTCSEVEVHEGEVLVLVRVSTRVARKPRSVHEAQEGESVTIARTPGLTRHQLLPSDSQ